MNNAKTELKRLSSQTPSRYLPLLMGDWFLTESSIILPNSDITASNDDEGKVNTTSTCELYGCRVYREPIFNNFIIARYIVDPVWHNDPEEDEVFDLLFELGKEEGTYLRNVFKFKKTPKNFFFWGEEGEKIRSYEIFHDAWDICGKYECRDNKCVCDFKNCYSVADGANVFRQNCDLNKFYSVEYLYSCVKDSDDLGNYEYNYSDIRNGKIYPSPFLWPQMKEEEFKTLITDRGIEELIKQSEDEKVSKMTVGKAVELYLKGEHRLEEIAAITKLKIWQIQRALNRSLV